MMEYLTHNTKDGDRWDLLAYEYYGNAFAIGFLLEANPDCASLPLLPSGLALKVLLIDAEVINPQESVGVPWR